jgi:hypothetical protein
MTVTRLYNLFFVLKTKHLTIFSFELPSDFLGRRAIVKLEAQQEEK